MSKTELEKDLSNYGSILMGVPFHINNGDLTVWQKNEHGLVIYFHSENFWRNPPTDSSIEYRATKAIEKYGIVYLPKDYVEGYKKTAWNEGNAYRQAIANQILGEKDERN